MRRFLKLAWTQNRMLLLFWAAALALFWVTVIVILAR
jgi:hypothetical protein